MTYLAPAHPVPPPPSPTNQALAHTQPPSPLAFPGNAVPHKWRIVSAPAFTLRGHPAGTQSHIQCLCPVLKKARIRAHHNTAKRLWQGIRAAAKGWVLIITTEQTVAGRQGLQQPAQRMTGDSPK